MNESSDSGFVLAESVARNRFDDDIYSHLDALVAVEFSRQGSDAQAGRFELSASKYQSLEQAAFEEAPRMEARPPQEVDWERVDERVSKFEGEVTESLRDAPNAGSDQRAFVDFSSKCFEHWLTYSHMYPDTNAGGGNPWAGAVRVLKRGRLLVIGDEARLEPAASNGHDRSGVIAMVKGAPARPATMPIDNRFALQAKLLSFLKANAKGHADAMPLEEIERHLPEVLGVPMPLRTMQVKLLVHLKRAGVVGSSQKGIFFIAAEADLIKSYCFHLTKAESAYGIMRRYQSRASAMNADLVLEDECAKGGPFINRRLAGS